MNRGGLTFAATGFGVKVVQSHLSGTIIYLLLVG